MLVLVAHAFSLTSSVSLTMSSVLLRGTLVEVIMPLFFRTIFVFLFTKRFALSSSSSEDGFLVGPGPKVWSILTLTGPPIS